MKGIMFSTFIQIFIGFCLSTQLVTSADVKNETSSVTTTTAKPSDLSGGETRYFESSIQHLRPGESLSKSVSHSYSKSNQDVAFRNPIYEKDGYEENPAAYGKSEQDEYYPDNKESIQEDLHKQPRYALSEDFSDSYDGSYQQQHYGKDGQSFEEVDHQGDPYSYADNSAKGQTSYGHQDYTRQGSDESVKDGSYGKGRPPFHYAYEVSSHQDNSGSLDASNVKSGYGSGETQSYSPKVLQQADYYSKPVQNSYVPEDIFKEDYSSVGHKGDYFPSIPKEAGYVSNVQDETGYFHGQQHDTSYSKQAGYSSKQNDPTPWVPVIPKSKPVSLTNDRKVSVYIKHLGHKTAGHSDNKERQGYILLPVVHEKMEEKLKEIKGQFRHEFRKNYQDDKHLNVRQSEYPASEKQVYTKTKVVQYPVDVKYSTIQHVPAYQNQELVKPHGKSVNSQDSYQTLKATVKNEAYGNAGYGNADHGNTGYGNADHGNTGYGNADHGNTGYGNANHGNIDYGNTGYGNADHGKAGYGSAGYGNSGYGNTDYENAGYESPKSYSVAEKSIEHSAPYVPQVVANYEEQQPEVKTYSKDTAGYDRPYKGNSGLPVVQKYETVYAKSPEYVPTYDIISAPKSNPVKIKGYRTPTYSSLYQARSYPRIVDLSSLTGKVKKSNPSHGYSAQQYKNTGIPVSSAYGDAAVKDQGKSFALILKNQKESEVAVFKPSPYSLKGRVSAKDLVQNFGLHDYESLLSAPRHGSGVGGSLYYDLHTFPAQHSYAPYSYRRSGLIPKKLPF